MVVVGSHRVCLVPTRLVFIALWFSGRLFSDNWSPVHQKNQLSVISFFLVSGCESADSESMTNDETAKTNATDMQQDSNDGNVCLELIHFQDN